MPTYDYVCAACGHGFERFEPIGDDARKACPKCGKKKAQRMLGTGVGVIFKGSGFYTTESRKSSAGKSDGKTGEAKESDSGAKDSAKADSKDGGKKKSEGAKANKKEKESKA